MRVNVKGIGTSTEIITLVSQEEKIGLNLVWTDVLGEYFTKEFDAETKQVLFDLENVIYIDSSVFLKLVRWKQALDKKGVAVYLKNANDHVQRILKLTRLERHLPVLEPEE